jgi:F-type H+-transporting ATPase subunit b
MMSTRTVLFAATLALVPALAFAQVEQPTDQPADNSAVDEQSAAGGSEVGRLTEEAAEIEPQPHDPTAHFNYFNFSYRGKDELGGPFGDGKMVDPHTGKVVMDEHGNRAEEEPMSPPFILMLVNFGLLLLILGKYGGAAARKLAEERHDQIKSALDEAAKLRDQAAGKLAEYETRIKDVDSEVKKLVDGIRADAEADKQRILAAAATQAEQMKKDAELRIAAEIELARAQLTREVAAAAAGATEKLLKEKLTADDQNKLVGTFITNVQAGGRKEAR